MPSSELNDIIHQAAHWIHQADGLLMMAGTGMSVDSNLSDIRGNHGLCEHCPALRDL